MKPLWGHIDQGHNSNVSKKQLCFLSFIKSSSLACGFFQDTDTTFTQCTIVYYYIYLHTDDMKYREEAGEKKRKHMNGEISIFEIKHSVPVEWGNFLMWSEGRHVHVAHREWYEVCVHADRKMAVAMTTWWRCSCDCHIATVATSPLRIWEHARHMGTTVSTPNENWLSPGLTQYPQILAKYVLRPSTYWMRFPPQSGNYLRFVIWWVRTWCHQISTDFKFSYLTRFSMVPTI